MMHESLRLLNTQPVQDLDIPRGAQRADIEHLGLPPGKEGRAVCPRQYRYGAADRPNLIGFAAVSAQRFLDDHRAHAFFQRPAEDILDLTFMIGVLIQEFLQRLFFNCREILLALQFFVSAHSLIDALAEEGFELFDKLGKRFKTLHLHLGPAHFGDHLLLQRDDLLDYLVTFSKAGEQIVLADLLCPRFDHGHGVFRSGNGEMKAALLGLLQPRVDHSFAVDKADHYRPDRAFEGNR